MKTGELLFESNPSFNVIQSFVDPMYPDIATLRIRRWDRNYMYGWKSPYPLKIFDKTGNFMRVVEIPAVRKAEIKIRVQFDKTVPIMKPLGGKIPMNFFQTSGHKFTDHSDYDGIMGNLHEINRMLQHNFNYRCLNDKESDQEIIQSDWPELIEAYNSLRSPSYKADLLRYYLLYKYGGIYTDDKSLFRYPLDSDVFGEVFNDNRCDGALLVVETCRNPEISFLVSKKGSIVMKSVLEKAISNINKRFYGESPFEITGNRCFQEILKDSKNVSGNWFEILGEQYYFFPRKLHHETLSIKGDLKWIQFVVPWSQTKKWVDPNYYVNLNFRRQVYKDRNDEYPHNPTVRTTIIFTSYQFTFAMISIIMLSLFLFFLIKTW